MNSASRYEQLDITAIPDDTVAIIDTTDVDDAVVEHADKLNISTNMARRALDGAHSDYIPPMPVHSDSGNPFDHITTPIVRGAADRKRYYDRVVWPAKWAPRSQQERNMAYDTANESRRIVDKFTNRNLNDSAKKSLLNNLRSFRATALRDATTLGVYAQDKSVSVSALKADPDALKAIVQHLYDKQCLTLNTWPRTKTKTQKDQEAQVRDYIESVPDDRFVEIFTQAYENAHDRFNFWFDALKPIEDTQYVYMLNRDSSS